MKLELQWGNAKFGLILPLFHLVWPLYLMYNLKKNKHIFYANSIFAHDLVAIGEFIVELQTGSARFRLKSSFFGLCDLEIWWMTSKNNGVPLLCNFNLVHHFVAICELQLELQPGNSQYESKSSILFGLCDLEIWRMTLKNNRAPL